MIYVNALRQEAEKYRDLARQAADADSRRECEDLAEVIEEVAMEVEDRESSG